jgi:hypothetical protein
MKRCEREIAIARPLEEVFDFFADMSRVAEWAPEDFVSVERVDEGAIGAGTTFRYVTNGASAKSTFAWTTFRRPSELAFSGPRVDVGPGWVEALGGSSGARGASTRRSAR